MGKQEKYGLTKRNAKLKTNCCERRGIKKEGKEEQNSFFIRENPLIIKNYDIWSNTGSLPAENDDIDSIRAYQNILNNIFSFSFRYGGGVGG